MGNFIFKNTNIKDLFVVDVICSKDDRGYFMETYNKKDFFAAGLDMQFVQENESLSKKGVLRGLHFQKRYPQGKLVRCVIGEVFDVAVDIRKDSKTFGQWYGVTLSAKNCRQFYIPGGFAHGFYVLSDVAKFCYKVTDFYNKDDEGAILWNDRDININWPLIEASPILSEKDRKNPKFCDIKF